MTLLALFSVRHLRPHTLPQANNTSASWSSLCLLLLAVILAGCVHRPSQLPMGNWNERQARLANFDDWQVTGKLGVRLPKDSGSANLRWQQIRQDYTLDLSGPLGSGRTIIQGRPGQVSMQQAGEPDVTAETPEALLLQRTGWQIPVTQLAYWVRALPNPKQPITHWEKNDAKQLILLEQDGWQIHYSQYELIRSATGEEILLPKRVVANYDSARLTFVIREWQLKQTHQP